MTHAYVCVGVRVLKGAGSGVSPYRGCSVFSVDVWEMNDSLIAGSVSGMLTRFLTCPLDVLKIRFQLQLEPISQVAITTHIVGLTA